MTAGLRRIVLSWKIPLKSESERESKKERNKQHRSCFNIYKNMNGAVCFKKKKSLNIVKKEKKKAIYGGREKKVLFKKKEERKKWNKNE